MRIPLMLRRKHGGGEDIKKSVHLCFHFIAKLPDRMMQPRGALERNAGATAGERWDAHAAVDGAAAAVADESSNQE